MQGEDGATTHEALSWHVSPNAVASAIAWPHFGLLEVAVSMLLMGLQTFLPFIPFFLITGANVHLWGLVRGSLYNFVGAFLGDSFAYWVVRRYGRAWVVRLVPERVMARWVAYFRHRRGFVIVIISRLVPVVPAGVINMAAGLAGMEYRPFALATLVGNVPATVLNGMLGNDLFTFGQNKYHLLEILAVFALLTLLGELWLRLNPTDGDAPPSPPRGRRGPRPPDAGGTHLSPR
ncbi:MAG: TVP38/TMEM64 family protein [Firmicutes bacterium]|nr:TVP38/TMEM64 family protein [Bacillota bacterium]